MVDFIFALCIAPLESAMSVVLHGAYTLTGSWGASLVLLSLAVNCALIPLYHLAETWQEDERAVQRAMAPKLAEFREVFSGRERYMYMRALYRLHGYSPIYALRTSFGLLIQVPFFFAAYHLLNAAPELAGASWLFLTDLGRPDNLLRLGGLHIHLMPFVMTAANLASAAVYTSRLTRRETIQLYGLAALFLVLLYASSSALLVYWTCNNLFSLGKNIVYTRFIYGHEAERAARAGKLPAPSPLPACLDFVLAAFAAAAFAAAVILRKRMGLGPLPLGLMGTAALCAISCLAVRLHVLRGGADMRDNGLARYYAIFPVVVGLTVFVCIWQLTSFKKLDSAPSWIFFRLYALGIACLSGWATARQPLLPFFRRMAALAESALPRGLCGVLFYTATLVMTVLVCWYAPAALYASDPDFFYESIGSLAGRLTFRGLCFLVLCAVIYSRTPVRMRPFMGIVWTWAALAALLFTFAAPGDYGTMDEFVLQDPSLLKTRLAPLVDIAVAGAAALLLWLALRKKAMRAVATLLQGAVFALCLTAAWETATAEPSQSASLDEATTRLPDYNDELFGFTRSGENTLVIMLDMFTGSHLGRILETTPELRDGLDGFTWYPDTMAPGATTLLSIGAILGGEAYTPPAVNARGTRPLRDELHEAFATLPRIFGLRGYAVALADVDELVPARLEAMCPAEAKPLVVGKALAAAYTGHWRKKNNLPSPLPETRAPFMVSVGLFRAAPWALRDHIYYDGSWMDTQTTTHNPSEGPYAMLDVLPEVANADAPANTFKYITSQIAHYPWRLDAVTCMPVERKAPYSVGKDRVIAEHVGNERCGLLALARFFAWMQGEGVYNNTQIIILSDHDGNDSPRFGAAFDHLRREHVPWKPDALLLVKQRGSHGPLAVDERPMSSADVVPLICAANGPCPGTTYPDPLQERETPRVRTHSSGMASIRRHGNERFTTTDYSVTGSMFAPENWTAPEKKP